MNRIDLYNEMILRENIRKAIRVVQNKRQGVLTEDNKLRALIRALLKEESSATEGPTMNTGGNALDQILLNTNTLSELEKEYKIVKQRNKSDNIDRSNLENWIRDLEKRKERI